MRPLPVETRTASREPSAETRKIWSQAIGGARGLEDQLAAVGGPVGLGVLAAAAELAQIGQMDLARIEGGRRQGLPGVLGVHRQAGPEEKDRQKQRQDTWIHGLIRPGSREKAWNGSVCLLFCTKRKQA